MKKLFFILMLIILTPSLICAQKKSTNKSSPQTVSGVDLDDYSSNYDGKTIRVYLVYEPRYNENTNLRPKDKDAEKVNSLYNHGITETMNATMGSNDDYYSRQMVVYGTGSKIRVRIPYKISAQIPNISALGYTYVTGKWHASSMTLVVTKITR